MFIFNENATYKSLPFYVAMTRMSQMVCKPEKNDCKFTTVVKMTCFWKDILPNTSAGLKYSVSSYGNQLESNKASLKKAFIALNLGTDTGLFALMTSMAMLETTSMSVSDRDSSKDKTLNGSANYSMFNLSEDLLLYIGFDGNLQDLNCASKLSLVVQQISIGIHKLGTERFLNFVRGGRKGFLDGTSYGVNEYRSTIATILSVIDKDPSLLTDCRRVNINLAHV